MRIKIDETNVIIGYFKLISEKPYKATGCNMQQNEEGIEVDDNLLDSVVVGESKYINGVITNN